MPHLGIDPVPVACQMVQAFQTIITRNKRPIDTGVISVTMIHTGEATNVIPDILRDAGHGAHLHHRAARPDRARMKSHGRATCAAFDALRVPLPPQLPAHRQPPGRNRLRAAKVLGEVVGPENVLPFEPTMGAEDFSYFLQAKPGCYFMIGNGDGTTARAATAWARACCTTPATTSTTT
jgi:metal-dependent amidase/aminoacylase/carboxypeptidase family protein